MADADYFLLIGDNEQGPWTLPQVQAFWLAGAVTLETLFAQPGMGEWKPLSTIPDVASALTPSAMTRGQNLYADEQRKIIDTVVNVLLPLENVSATPVTANAPTKVDVSQMRQWLRDKLLAIDFYPVADAASDKVMDYLAAFSGDEQRKAFGDETLLAYQRGDITAAQLIGKTDKLVRLASFREMCIENDSQLQSDTGEFTPENALWIMAVVEHWGKVCSASQSPNPLNPLKPKRRRAKNFKSGWKRG